MSRACITSSRALTATLVALVPHVCNAALDEQQILQLAELDARAYCLSHLPRCDYQIQSLGRPDGSKARWWVSVSHVVTVDQWRLFPPGSSSLDLRYDEDGHVVSDNRNELPPRTESTARIGFMKFCDDALSRAGATWAAAARQGICACAAAQSLAHKAVSMTFELRRESWPQDMLTPEAKSFAGDTIARSIEACIESGPMR